MESNCLTFLQLVKTVKVERQGHYFFISILHVQRTFLSLLNGDRVIIFIGPESDHWECLSLVEVVTIAHVDDGKRVDNSLVQIWKVKFGHKVEFLFRL